MKKLLLISLALGVSTLVRAQDAASSATPTASPATSPSGGTATAENVVVTSQALDVSREDIVPSLGATRYTAGPDRLSGQAQGENAGFNQTILRFPGVTQDSFGQLHVRGEHANLQYRINDVLVPEGISGFGQELSTRFADSVSLITGSLPAQFGFRTTGIIDVHTKTGADFAGGEAAVQVGSFDTVMPTFEYGGIAGKVAYYTTESYLHNGIGIENPTRSSDPIHDNTDQFKLFSYIADIIDDSSRLVFMVSGNHSNFEIPNTAGVVPSYTVNGRTDFNSAQLDETQAENSAYIIAAYQKHVGDFGMQASVFSRYSGVLFRPDNIGDLFFNGVASRVAREIYTNGVELDTTYKLTDQHTLRGGLLFTASYAPVGTVTTVFPVDTNGNVTSDTPQRIVNNSSLNGYFGGLYLQDEWKPFKELTINFGGRFDVASVALTEMQFSPRLNVVYTPWESTAFHAGYARYFTPPPLEEVEQGTVALFNGTTNASAIQLDSSIKSERAHYFDGGVTQKIGKDFQVGIDGFFKTSRNILDEGQFGQALIQSAFNYKHGEIFGGEVTMNYTHDPFSAYLNVGSERARGKTVGSAQFLFDPDEYAYIQNHWVYLDHDQRVTASAGVAYTLLQDWTFSADALYGNGLRSGFANTQRLHPYETLNLGVERRIALEGKRAVKIRFDVVNLLDKVYELRDGSGIGVGAAQYGQRRGFYGTVAFDF